MSSVVDPLLSTVTLDLLRPKETLGNPEDHFRKVRPMLLLGEFIEHTLRDVFVEDLMTCMLLARVVNSKI